MRGNNKTNVPGHNQPVFPEPNLKANDGNQQIRAKQIRLSADELYKQGQPAREELTEQLLDLIYERINLCNSEGQTETTLTINYLDYKGVLSDVIDVLASYGYEVTEKVIDDFIYARNEPAYQGYNLTVSWDQSGKVLKEDDNND